MGSENPLTSRPHGSGILLSSLREDAAALSAEDFEERYGSAFLLLTAAMLSEPQGPAATDVQLLGLDEPASDTASMSQLVYPLQRTERSVGHLLTIGRSSNNDVVIRDVSISRFHAFVKPDGEGRLCLQDAKSTNGTSINGTNAPSQGTGPALPMKSGDNVRLGQIELTFLDVEALRQFVLAHDH